MMMDQGVNTQTIAPVVDASGSNSVESRYVEDVTQGQASSYLPLSTASEAAPWTVHRVDGQPTENGTFSDSVYQRDRQKDPPAGNAQDGLNVASLANISALGTTNPPQDYSSYAAYSNTTDPYGYATAGYASYYSAYPQQPNQSYTQQQPNQTYPQQQPSHSYSQQLPSHSYPQQQPSHSYPQQQPSHSYAQQQPSHSYPQQQPSHSYAQQQPNHSYSQQPANQSYSQSLGAYQNTGYQPLSSFQNTGSYGGTASYSTTYYNPADYQTAGGYPTNGYSQTQSWNDGNYANYASQQYSSYTSGTTSAYASGTAPASSVNYQHHYKQWADYYSQTEVTCAPGTEHLSVASTSSQSSSVPGVYNASNSQPPQSFTSSWKPESSSSGLPTSQPGSATNGGHDSYWKQEAPSFQNHHASPPQPQFQKSLDSKTSYDNFQDQQNSASQDPNLQYPAAHQVPQSYQSPMQSVPSLDPRRVSNLQIPTNPRIASNLALGSSKTDKDGSTIGAAAKPAYISVLVPKPDDKLLSNNMADSVVKHGMFPKSLQGYVERAFSRCKEDPQKMAASQAIMKEIITNATTDGTLHTRDWDIEPLFPLPSTDFVVREISQSSMSVSSLPKYKRSPSRRTKSRWEPLPEEKLVDKPISVVANAGKVGSWERKPFNVNTEIKGDAFSNIKFSLPQQKSLTKIAQRPVKRQRITDGWNAADNGDSSGDSDKEQSLTAYYSGAMALANSAEEKKRRENRSKRFEKGQGHQAEISYFRPKGAGAGNFYTRQASALMLSKSFDDGGSGAVEDIDWDALTIKGTCLEIEKRYLRLTSAPDPCTVRPEEVLEKALLMVQNSEKNYLYKCDQLKSIRQDLTVQHIRNQFTVKVYEAHARLALEVGDLPEYNQCQSQLQTLYAEGIQGCKLEFTAYGLLSVILHSNNKRELLTLMSRLTEEAKRDEAVKHALAVRAAVTLGNYVKFFKLYKMAPNLNACLMDLCAEKMRYNAVKCMSRACHPIVPVSYIALVLGFSVTNERNDEKDSDGFQECVEWLKAHGASIIAAGNGEMQLDTKASRSSLYMPEPEDAVAHGDANLAVNDFLTRPSS